MPRFQRFRRLTFVLALGALAASATAAEIKRLDANPTRTPLPMRTVGRTVTVSGDHGVKAIRLQWPGVYFEAAFEGTSLYVETGAGRAIYHVVVDQQPPLNAINSGASLYCLDGLPNGHHTVRVELATECQGGAVEFVGLAVPAESGEPAAMPAARRRRIEFIGDSHTVGYGNTSPKRQCTPDEIWATTDTSQAFGPLVAKHYDADYEINAISGRGIVRNYNGGKGDTLPEAYPFALFHHEHRVSEHARSPDVIVVALGTNDFSTKLNPGEKWKTRDELHADYEQTYVQFVSELRTLHPQALVLLAATDMSDGEIAAEVRKVTARLKEKGDNRIEFVPFSHLELTACDWHPSLQDDLVMAADLEKAIDAHSDAWTR